MNNWRVAIGVAFFVAIVCFAIVAVLHFGDGTTATAPTPVVAGTVPPPLGYATGGPSFVPPNKVPFPPGQEFYTVEMKKGEWSPIFVFASTSDWEVHFTERGAHGQLRLTDGTTEAISWNRRTVVPGLHPPEVQILIEACAGTSTKMTLRQVPP